MCNTGCTVIERHLLFKVTCVVALAIDQFWRDTRHLLRYSHIRVARLFRQWCAISQGYCCGGAIGDKCCLETKDSEDSQTGTIEGSSVLFDSSKFIPLDPTQELIFPPALKVKQTSKVSSWPL